MLFSSCSLLSFSPPPTYRSSPAPGVMETRGMTRELLSSWATLPVWRDITLLNYSAAGHTPSMGHYWTTLRGERREEKMGRRRERLRKGGKKGTSEEEKWGSMKGKVWEVDSLQDVARISNQWCIAGREGRGKYRERKDAERWVLMWWCE